MFLLVKASVSIGLLIVPLLYSFRYLPEIYAGKTFSETSPSERGIPILVIIALMLVLAIFLFLWIAEEAAKQPAFPGAIPQQSK